jgi:demethylmenaquinone methyltransferase/2-methoxy-6-polyprenyl-1,4-benzoquinol methylase
VTYQWVDCDRDVVSGRYDRIAPLIPFFDRLFFVPWNLRKNAAQALALSDGECVLDIGCGTGRNFPYLREAVGPSGRIYGTDISRGMLRKAQEVRDDNGWRNITLTECDAADYVAPEPLDAVLFSLSFTTMPHHRAVLQNVWNQLRPGGRLVIMDAKVPPGLGGRLILPFSLWLMKHTMLGNPLIHPWEVLGEIAQDVEMNESMFSSYYICSTTKPFSGAGLGGLSPGPDYRIAAE